MLLIPDRFMVSTDFIASVLFQEYIYIVFDFSFLHLKMKSVLVGKHFCFVVVLTLTYAALEKH